MDESIALEEALVKLTLQMEAIKETQTQLISVCLTRAEIMILLQNLRQNSNSLRVSKKLSRILQHPFYKSVSEGESVH